LIVVVLEERQIEAVGGDDSDAHELLQKGAQVRVFVHEVVVEFDALLARDAPQRDDDGLVFLLGLLERFGQAVVNPEPVGFDLYLVVAHFGFARVLCRRGAGNRERARQRQ
jgi:hypothetical protein